MYLLWGGGGQELIRVFEIVISMSNADGFKGLFWIVLDLYRIPGIILVYWIVSMLLGLYEGHEWQAALLMALLDSAELDQNIQE